MSLCIRDILERPFFDKAKVLAGHGGLDHEVKWVHIVEISRFGHLLNGNDVILTTGLGWANDEEKSLSYLQQLLDNNAAALCVELVMHVKKLPDKMLKVADEHNFPIIGFPNEVRFIDITKDLHEVILGHHENIWWRLENLHKQLNSILIHNGSAGDFLRILHKETNHKIGLVYDEQYRFFPSPPKRQQYEWIQNLSEAEHNFVNYPIQLLGDTIGHLYYIEDPMKIASFDELALKRCKEIFEQFFWKHHTEKEAEQLERNEWIIDAINGVLSKESIQEHIEVEFENIQMINALIAVIPFEQSLLRTDQTNLSETALIMLLRPVFNQHDIHILAVKDEAKSHFIILLINENESDLFLRVQQSLETLIKNSRDPMVHQYVQWISFGRVITDYRKLPNSYETALTTLYFQQNIKKLDKPFYHELGVYRLIDRMGNLNDLKDIVDDYLTPIIDYDKKNNTELLHTLEVFFKNHGARNETADQLNVVRQTLYHRLRRIENLLGEDYLKPEKRLMIEFSLYAHKYIDD